MHEIGRKLILDWANCWIFALFDTNVLTILGIKSTNAILKDEVGLFS